MPRIWQEFAGFVGVKHAIALANGTVALDVALTALELVFTPVSPKMK